MNLWIWSPICDAIRALTTNKWRVTHLRKSFVLHDFNLILWSRDNLYLLKIPKWHALPLEEWAGCVREFTLSHRYARWKCQQHACFAKAVRPRIEQWPYHGLVFLQHFPLFGSKICTTCRIVNTLALKHSTTMAPWFHTAASKHQHRTQAEADISQQLPPLKPTSWPTSFYSAPCNFWHYPNMALVDLDSAHYIRNLAGLFRRTCGANIAKNPFITQSTQDCICFKCRRRWF